MVFSMRIVCVFDSERPRNIQSVSGGADLPGQIYETTCLLICCVPLVSTRKEARLSIRFFSLFTVDDEGYVQQTNKQNLTLNSNEDKEHCVATLYIYEPKNVQEKETTRMFLNS